MARELPDAETLVGAIALTDSGERVGLIVDVRQNDETSQPEWAWARTGIEETDVSLIPLDDARYHEGGLVVPYSTARIESAPRHPAGEELTPADQVALRQHYAEVGEDADPEAAGGPGSPAGNAATQAPVAPTGGRHTTPEPAPAPVPAPGGEPGAEPSRTGFVAGLLSTLRRAGAQLKARRRD